MAVAAFCCIGAANLFINERMGRESNFINLTIHSYIQLTAWQYAQLILSVLMLIWAGKLLDTQAEYEVQKYIERSVKKDRGVGKRSADCHGADSCSHSFCHLFRDFFPQ